MLVFAVDTATVYGAVGWTKLEGSTPYSPVSNFATMIAPAVPGHAETLLSRMETVLSFGGYEFKDIDLFVFGRGPGTFTGVRIGLSTVKGIALALDKPVIGFSSLEAVALGAGREGLVLSLIDAKRRELFAALYRVSLNPDGRPMAEPILEEWVEPASSVIERVAQNAGASTVHVSGSGIPPYRDIIGEALNAVFLPETDWMPSPFWMCRIGHMRYRFKGGDNLAAVEPVYIREPDARLPKVLLK